MNDYRKHRDHLLGQNTKGKPRCFQCGEDLHETGDWVYGGMYGCPTSDKPDITSAFKPKPSSYFYDSDEE